MKHPLDAPYPEDVLEFIRTHLHKKVRKLSALTRDEYVILFDESNESDNEGHTIKYQAGRPISICLCVSPLNGTLVEQMVTRAFSLDGKSFTQLLRHHSLVKRSDAVTLYGLEVSGTPSPFDMIREELKDFEKKVKREVYVTVTVTDKRTGRKVSRTERNGNAFDIERRIIRQLRTGL